MRRARGVQEQRAEAARSLLDEKLLVHLASDQASERVSVWIARARAPTQRGIASVSGGGGVGALRLYTKPKPTAFLASDHDTQTLDEEEEEEQEEEEEKEEEAAFVVVVIASSPRLMAAAVATAATATTTTSVRPQATCAAAMLKARAAACG